MRLMNIRKQAKDTLEKVSDASMTVVATSEWATIALVAVAAVSLLALGIGLLNLGKVSR